MQRYLYTHNNDGQLIVRTFQVWNEDDLVWEDDSRNLYTYNDAGYLIYDVIQAMVGFGWSNSERIDYFYEPISGVEQQSELNENFTLYQNYPNPFNSSSIISFSIKEDGIVSLRVYDVLGNEVAQLVNELKVAGNYEVEFHAKDLPSGIYFYTLKTRKYSQSKKMILLK